MNERYGHVMKKLSALKTKLVEQYARKVVLENCEVSLREMNGLVTEFDEKLFIALVNKVIIGRSGEMRFVCRDESEQ